jgi:hypothetical protein
MLTLLSELPEAFRPTYFGLGERARRRPEFEVANAAAFRSYLVLHGSVGLFADGYWLDVDPGGQHRPMQLHRPARLNLYGRSLARSIAFMREAVPELSDVMYANACVPDEYEHRNALSVRIEDSLSGGSSHSFIGRDVLRYVPGLYWLNYFSDEYAAARGVDVKALAARLSGQLTRTTRGHLLELYDAPTRWAEWSDSVDEVIESTAGFFSKRHIAIPESASFREIDAVTMKIQKEWP